MARSEQRARLFRSRTRRTKTFTWDGDEWTLREPTLAERDELIAESKRLGDDKITLGAFQRKCARMLLIDEDGKSLIEPADADSLAALSPDFFDALAAASKVLLAPPKVEELEKNSEGTPSDSSSSA